MEVVDVNTCKVVPNAYVDFWHCNSTGVYSGFAVEGTEGESFNRGIQPTDSDGIVQMTTTFPGWYRGRATHIHIAAHLDGTVNSDNTHSGGTVSHIGQLFFPEDVLSQVEDLEVYNTNTVSRLLNANDGIFNQQNTGYDAVTDISFIGISFEDGLIASISVGVDSKADYSDELASGGGGGPGGPGGPPRA
jgi:protocatechuate 3,4-dioxygenase beta subunit